MLFMKHISINSHSFSMENTKKTIIDIKVPFGRITKDLEITIFKHIQVIVTEDLLRIT